MKKLIFFLFTWLLFVTTSSFATTRYVKIGGSDGAAGTSWATAWATTGKVQTTLAGGDTVYFGTGTWRDVHLVPPKGSASDRTTYACSSFVQGIAHLWGSQRLTTWVNHSGNVWKARFVGNNCWYDEKNAYTCAQDDSLLRYGTAIPASAGRFYHDTAKDTIYAWCYGNANPNTESIDMEASCHEVFDFADDNTGYTTVWGFDLRYGNQGIIIFNGNGGTEADSVLIAHCNISSISYKTSENPACIFSGKGGNEYSPSTWGKDNVVRACTLSNFWDPSETSHGDGAAIYTQTRLVIESCYVDGRGRGNVGIIFKNETQGCVARFNTLKSINTHGLRVAYSGQADSFYGNIVFGNGSNFNDGGANLQDNPQSNPWYSNSCVWLNNTFYNCGDVTGLKTAEDLAGGTGHKFKYNIQYKPTSANYMSMFEQNTKAKWTIDSNLIYRPSFASGAFYYLGSVSLATWRTTHGLDLRSDTVYAHVGFNNPAGGDFSRPSSSQEMDLIYGGKHWTRYGAWQPTVGGDDYPPALVTNVTCYETTTTTASLRCHRNDSADCVGYQVRYAVGSTPPGGVTSGLYGDSSDANGRDDTVFVLSGLNPNTQYTASIFAKDEVPNWSALGSGSWKTFTTKQSADITPPAPVTGLDTTLVTSTSVSLIFNKNDSADCGGYMLRYNVGTLVPYVYFDGTFLDSNSSANETTFTVSNLEVYQVYSFSVFARDEVPNWSDWADGSSITLRTHTLPPADLKKTGIRK